MGCRGAQLYLSCYFNHIHEHTWCFAACLLCSQDTCWKDLNSEHLLSRRVVFPGPVQPVGQWQWLQCAPCLLHVQKTGFWGPNSAALVVQSALCTSQLSPSVLTRARAGVHFQSVGLSPLLPLQSLVAPGCHHELCQHVMLPTAMCQQQRERATPVCSFHFGCFFFKYSG